MKIFKSRISMTCLAVVLIAASASATTVTLNVGISGTDIIGEVIPTLSSAGGPSGQANRDAAMVNQLIGMVISTSTTIDSVLYNRSANSFSPLPAVVLAGDVVGGPTSTLTLSSAFRYLVASYDGTNIKQDGSSGGSEIWDISGLVAGTVINFPSAAQSPTGQSSHLQSDAKYGITSWTLFNPFTPGGGDGGGDNQVPDGGSTIALLGFALVGVDQLRRKISKS